MAEYIQSDSYATPLEHVKLGRLTIPAAAATVGSITAVHTAKAATGPAKMTLVAASADADKLTIAFPATSADTPVGVLTVTLLAAAGDVLAVTASDATGLITISLAKTSANKNTATLVQAALRGVTPQGGAAGIVKGIDVSAVVCTAAGNWDAAAVAPKATGQSGVAFAGGAGETVLAGTAVNQPTTPRAITATAGGTDGDIGAVSVIIYGTNIDNQPISETLTAFTLDTAGTKTGAKAFKTITSIFFPSHDGTGATVSIGTADVLGLPYKFTKRPLCWATLAGVIEANAPAITVDADEIEKNTIDLNSALNSSEVCIYLGIPEA